MASSVFDAAKHSEQQFELCRQASFSKLLARSDGAAVPTRLRHVAAEHSPDRAEKQKKLWKLMATYIPSSEEAIQRSIANHIEYTLARTRLNISKEDCYRATAYSIRDRLIELLNDTNAHFAATDCKRLYYLSMEFLVGRATQNALVNLDLEESYARALESIGFNLEELYEYEHDPALGNGGLGRLAACFLDSMATLNLPCWGYGLRYTYGIFEQKIVNGRQVEHPDYWLMTDNPWEICRQDVSYAVRFFGEVTHYKDPDDGRIRYRWTGGQIVQAVAYDNPIPGFDTLNCINMRLWRAAPAREFDFKFFDQGKYLDSVAERQEAEAISAVLYPNDNSDRGRLLRLQQQYFFCCASIQDILRRFKRRKARQWTDLPDKIAMQLNDTHPAIAIPELMRILVDIEHLEWRFAWSLVKKIASYTNHTVLPEALEKWPVALFEELLPRHLLIINDINFQFLDEVRMLWGPQSEDKINKLSIYEEGTEKKLRMANLACIGSHRVNGVAALHTDILKRSLFADFVYLARDQGVAEKVVNMTNGVTPRRWIHDCNRPLSNLFSRVLGNDAWLKDLSLLKPLEYESRDKGLQRQWNAIKLANKRRLAAWVAAHCNVAIDPETMLFDIQVKRIHEYKRQLMNIFYILYRYLVLRELPPEARAQVQPRAALIGGKSAPGYEVAKIIIKLCNSVADLVNNDPAVDKLLKVAFLPNYNVSSAMIIIPASDISHQISTAGTEASGTSCMKFVMNGGLLIGTLDGANVEIKEECGPEVLFEFGLKEAEVHEIRNRARHGDYPLDARLARVFDFIRSGELTKSDPEGAQAQQDFERVLSNLQNNGFGYVGDNYLVCYDFSSFITAQEDVDKLYREDPEEWTRRCITSAARMGKFSSDRTIKEYATVIWNLDPCPVELPMSTSLATFTTPVAEAAGAAKAAVASTASATAAAVGSATQKTKDAISSVVHNLSGTSTGRAPSTASATTAKKATDVRRVSVKTD